MTTTKTTTATLGDALPSLLGIEFEDTPARKLAGVAVTAEHRRLKGGKRWPGPHKNVYVWVELANGKAVAMNENPSRGLSFPVTKA